MKDGGADLTRCLSAVRSQELADEVEIIVVDSGSTDDSVSIALAHGAAVHEIPAEHFTHGGARNSGAMLAKGEILAFVSQDAVPVGVHWLENLTRPLKGSGEVGGVYGRQLPHDNAAPPEVFFLDFMYGPDPRCQTAGSVNELNMKTTLFSNVNAAMRRGMWERFPFVDDIIMSEDQEWSRRVLLEGFALVYEPQAAVRHSHNYSLRSAFRRFFDSGVSAERAYLAGARHSSRVLRNSAFEYARRELVWLARTGQYRWIPYTALYESVKLAGLVLGANHRRLPKPAKRRLSALPAHWDRSI